MAQPATLPPAAREFFAKCGSIGGKRGKRADKIKAGKARWKNHKSAGKSSRKKPPYPPKPPKALARHGLTAEQVRALTNKKNQNH